MIEYLKYMVVSISTAAVAMLLSALTMWVGGLLVIPALQTWYVMKYMEKGLFASFFFAAVPWVGIYFSSLNQPTLTYTVIKISCLSALVGTVIHWVRYYVYPQVKNRK
ncbi:TPA: hypothetical protein ACF35K_000746 [Vibrio parahaemolyticus]